MVWDEWLFRWMFSFIWWMKWNETKHFWKLSWPYFTQYRVYRLRGGLGMDCWRRMRRQVQTGPWKWCEKGVWETMGMKWNETCLEALSITLYRPGVVPRCGMGLVRVVITQVADAKLKPNGETGAVGSDIGKIQKRTESINQIDGLCQHLFRAQPCLARDPFRSHLLQRSFTGMRDISWLR